jgi:hypothetical protein
MSTAPSSAYRGMASEGPDDSRKRAEKDPEEQQRVQQHRAKKSGAQEGAAQRRRQRKRQQKKQQDEPDEQMLEALRAEALMPWIENDEACSVIIRRIPGAALAYDDPEAEDRNNL